MRYTPKLLPSLSGNVGMISLNNPKSMHALTTDMLHSMEDVLKEWLYKKNSNGEMKSSIRALIMKSATEQNEDEKRKKTRYTFCSGGDVKQIYFAGVQEHDSTSNNTDVGQGRVGLETADFFRQEYIVNHMLASSKIPQVSIWDGVVMGGGVGISIHGKYRIATENTVWAMPETAIGLFPDVGMLYWLSRNLPKSTAAYIALTGQRLRAPDLLYTGIATHYIPSKDLPAFEQELIHSSNVSKLEDIAAPLLMMFHREMIYNDGNHGPVLKKHESSINTVFGSKEFDLTLEEIIDRLKTLSSIDSGFCQTTIDTLTRLSPTSLKVTLEGLHRSFKYCNSLEEDLQMEYRLSQAFLRNRNSDFYEGIKTVLVDKTGETPAWNPSTLEQVTGDMIESYFAPIENEWTLPAQYTTTRQSSASATTKSSL